MNCNEVSRHAIRRYKERSNKNVDTFQAKNELIKLCNKARLAVLKKKFHSIALLQHDFKECQYYKDSNWVYVVIDMCIITIHGGDADRWVYDNKPTLPNK